MSLRTFARRTLSNYQRAKVVSQRVKKGDGRQVGFWESPSSSSLAAKERTVACEETEKLARRKRRHRLRR